LLIPLHAYRIVGLKFRCFHILLPLFVCPVTKIANA
jgi:hypothetical protein